MVEERKKETDLPFLFISRTTKVVRTGLLHTGARRFFWVPYRAQVSNDLGLPLLPLLTGYWIRNGATRDSNLFPFGKGLYLIAIPGHGPEIS